MNTPQPSRVTLKDIARKLGLSHGAVSLALRNSNEIALATRERVQATAREMGYQPNAMAAGLAQFKRNSTSKPINATLGWLNFWADPKKLHSFKEFECYWQGAQASAEKFGYRLEEFACDPKASLSQLEKVLIARGIKGLFVPPTGMETTNWGGLHLENFSVVRIGRSLETPSPHNIAPNQMANAMLAFDEIHKKGYKRIGYAGEPWIGWTYAPGFLWAQMMTLPEKSRVTPFLFHHSESAHSQQSFEKWLQTEKPDAILTENALLPDMLAKAGYRVPDDMGLAALTVLDCPIDAGIYQNPEEIGRVSVLLMVSLMNDHDRGFPAIPREILIKGRWMDGDSLPNRAAQ
jgi:LacI family transcriptional regulator